MVALILAGGGGTRLWPVSRKSNPKQIETFVGVKSMLRTTFDRLRLGFSPEDIFVATSAQHAKAVREQLPELPESNLITEPCRRDTASAIGYALLRISRTRPDEIFVLINSDAHVRDEGGYHRAIVAAGQAAADSGRAVLIGITPTYPETGYGYIEMGAPLGQVSGGYPLHEVARFVEKPDAATAERYLAQGNYLWNATLIVAPVARFLELYAKHLPEHAAIFGEMRAKFGRDDERREIESLFSRLPAVSVDYGILEKESGLTVMPADFGWMDIGNWRTVHEMLAEDGRQNVVRGRHLQVDSAGNFIHVPDGKLVATVGVSDTIVVDTGDALLICPRERAHEVKRIVEMLGEEGDLDGFL